MAFYAADKEAWVFALGLAVIAGLFAFALRMLFAHQDERRDRAREYHEKHLACLARNVYFEARGEPISGQYAVAEVTMNRAASPRFPGNVCDVVHQKNWDPIRRRYVGAFSWTEFKVLREPSGEEWERAKRVAEAVYYQADIRTMQGALYFHAAHIHPEWAKSKKPLTRIGNHVFYR